MKLTLMSIQPVRFSWPARFLSLQDRGTSWAITPELAHRIAMQEAERLGPSRLVSVDSVYVDSRRAPTMDVPSPRQALASDSLDILGSITQGHPDIARALQMPIPLDGSGGDYFEFHVAYRIWYWSETR